MNTNTCEMHRMLCLSTAHLRESTRNRLDEMSDEMADNGASDIIVYEKHGYGWFLPVDENMALPVLNEDTTEFPDLIEALRFAYYQGADWLMLDADGPTVSSLKTY